MPDHLDAEIRALAERDGAVGVGIAGVRPFADEETALRSSLSSGRSSRLGFTYRDPAIATDVSRSFPWARCLVVMAHTYLHPQAGPARAGPVVARFAVDDHYAPLRETADAVAGLLRDRGFRAEVLIDDNRLVDRAAAVRAGVGWWGKSTMVLAPGHGPWMLLGSVVTDAVLEESEPMRRSCGTCVACYAACPTAALSDRGLDARRCLAAWLQTPGSIPHWIRPHLGRRIYGCDDCLTSCPPGQRMLSIREKGHEATAGESAPDGFARLLADTDDALVERFGWWFVPRRSGRYLRRNLLVAAGNAGEAKSAIISHLSHPSSMIRGHAYWAHARGEGGADLLRSQLGAETVPEARDELTIALLMAERPETHELMLMADEWAGTESAVRGLALLGDPLEGSLRLLLLVDGETAVVPAPDGITDYARLEPATLPLVGEPFTIVHDPDRILDRLRRLESGATV